MARKDYYQILGLAPDVGTAAIRDRYRALARRHHPDHAGAAGAARFREVAEAYEVLSNRERRLAYNRTLDRAQPATVAPLRAAGHRAEVGPPVEPLVTAAGGVWTSEPLVPSQGGTWSSAGRRRLVPGDNQQLTALVRALREWMRRGWQ